MTKARAVAHIHSEWSDDASWPLDRLATAFHRRGRSVLLMCEHSRTFTPTKWAEYTEACAQASTPEVLIIPGLEYNDPDNIVHLPVWGEVPFLSPTPQPPEVLSHTRESNGIAVFAHPWRRNAWRHFDPTWAKDLTAIEIWNRKYDGWSPNPEATAYAKRLGLPPFVSLDFHGPRQFFPLAMELTLPGPPTRTTVEDALRTGQFEALAFSRSALRLTTGISSLALSAAESARALAARTLRTALRR
ncbi:MAG: PHP domain-containing protein, partial [Catenulispora sp.]|nr:PHP domain-containing protein [Catenulispora sp.]